MAYCLRESNKVTLSLGGLRGEGRFVFTEVNRLVPVKAKKHTDIFGDTSKKL